MFEEIGVNKKESDDLMSNEKVRIAVIGVGGAGCNTVDRMMKSGIKSAQTIAVNTDQLHLKVIQAHKRGAYRLHCHQRLGSRRLPGSRGQVRGDEP